MKIVLNGDEFKAWHEVGHATVCLHLGGDIRGIEFLEGDVRGFAVTRGCLVMPDTKRSVACGGFAAEFYLLRAGFIQGVNLNDPEVVAAVSQQIFSNAWDDHQKFIGRTVIEDDDFTQEEKERFMNYAIARVAPILKMYFPEMKLVVSELLTARKIDGARVRELLRPGIPR
jgi:urease gamma subunit